MYKTGPPIGYGLYSVNDRFYDSVEDEFISYKEVRERYTARKNRKRSEEEDLSDVSTRKVGRTDDKPNALAGIEPEKTHYELQSIQPSFEPKNWLYFAGVYGITAWIFITPAFDSLVQSLWALFVIVSMITVLLYSEGGDGDE